MKKAILMAVASTMMAQAAFAETTRVTVNTRVIILQERQRANATLDAVVAQAGNMMEAGDGNISEAQLSALSQTIAALPLRQRLSLIDAAIVRIADVKKELQSDEENKSGKIALGSFGAVVAGIVTLVAMVGISAQEGGRIWNKFTVPMVLLGVASANMANKASKHNAEEIKKLDKMATEIGTALLQVRAATVNQLQGQEL